MRKIKAQKIRDVVSQLALEANFSLRADVYNALERAYLNETNKRAKKLFKILLDNAKIAKKEKIPICQDTGIVVVFVKIGNQLKIVGDLIKAINEGVKEAYKKGHLRKSVCDPLSRINTKDNTPVVIYAQIVRGENLEINLCVKGFGAENKSQVKMFEPTASTKEIKNFVINTVKEAGPDACPPFVVGVGIGGTFEQACVLAKEAAFKKIRNPKSEIRNRIDKLEKDLQEEINKLNIGPMGLGGKTTCLGVNILTYPTHIAGLPVAVNISCHATRSAKIVL